MDRSFQAGKSYNFSLFPAGDEWKLALTDGDSGKNYVSDAFKRRRAETGLKRS
jgi:maltose/maltodextrin transport system permease protein